MCVCVCVCDGVIVHTARCVTQPAPRVYLFDGGLWTPETHVAPVEKKEMGKAKEDEEEEEKEEGEEEDRVRDVQENKKPDEQATVFCLENAYGVDDTPHTCSDVECTDIGLPTAKRKKLDDT